MNTTMMSKAMTITHSVQHNLRVIIVFSMAILLGACGFHLRGSGNFAMPEAYRNLQVIVPEGTQLKAWIRAELTALNVKLDDSGSPRLHVLAVRPTRQELTGSLTEIQIGVEADYRLENAQGEAITATRTVTSRRSYQYNRNTVSISDQQSTMLQTELYQDAARQIVRQVSTGRLPALQAAS